MKKGIVLSLSTLFLTGIIALSVWYFNGQKEIATSNKELFIPNNSALVLNLNGTEDEIKHHNPLVVERWMSLRNRVMTQISDTLVKRRLVDTESRVMAYRVEGRSQIVSLMLLNINDLMSKGKITDLIKTSYPQSLAEERDFAGFTITTLKISNERLFYALCGGILLLSDSQLYIEDGIKQYGENQDGESTQAGYRNIGKFFSSNAPVNLYVSETFFRNLLPQFMDLNKMSPRVELSELFRWGALDGDIHKGGISLNGFMNYDEQGKSYLRTLFYQIPSEGTIIEVVPAVAHQVKLLNLSDVNRYVVELDNYLHRTHTKRKVEERKDEFKKCYQKELTEVLVPLMKGEFAIVTLGFSSVTGKSDGVIIADLKSESLCRTMFDEALGAYAASKRSSLNSFKGTIHLGNSYSYYKLPHTDLLPVMLGYFLDDIENRLLMIDDGYMIIASSEEALRNYITHKRAHATLTTTDWYKSLKDQLSKKYNLAYFSLLRPTLERYTYFAKSSWREYLQKGDTSFSQFTAFASQWSNEEGMLYNHTYVSTDSILPIKSVKPQLSSSMTTVNSMKPVKVKNHMNGSTELFVQDDSLFVYLMNKDNRVLWKRKLSERIISEIYQIDTYKNGKLQYLFSTSSTIFLIDRNGKNVGKFPLKLTSPCRNGITVFDYDKTRDYRIFAPLANQKVMLYDQRGDVVDGWKAPIADKEIMTKVEHFRVEGKDYVVFADRVRAYILNRRGEERVRVGKPIEIKKHAVITLIEDRKGKFICLTDGAKRYRISFNGELTQL